MMISRVQLAALAREGAVLAGIGTFLAILGPYGTNAYGWPAVWVYWTGLILLGGVSGHLGGRVVRRLFPRWPDWAYFAAAAPILSIPVTIAVFAINTAYSGRVCWTELPLTWFFVLVIACAVAGVGYGLRRLEIMRAAEASSALARPASALLDKLPVRLRSAPLLAMKAEDHYLRIRTGAGEALILMRLSDAVAACAALDGACTHRSWWVARPAVTDAKKGDGRGVLILTDGTEVPVSRTYYPALKESGWF